MASLKLLSQDELRRNCPFKWHKDIPENGISLGVADIDFTGPAGINEYIKSQLIDGYAFYQKQSGLDSAIDSVVDYLSQFNANISHNSIQITPGTMIGIYSAMKFISKKEGHILSVGPIYGPIHYHATDNGNELRWININHNGLDIDELTNSITRETKMISICNPLNPVGHVFTESEIKAISQICVDYNTICFSDELYAPLVFKGKHSSILQFDDLLDRSISLFGFSKAYGLAGYRSGFLHAGTAIIDGLKDIVNHQLVSPSPVASIVCKYALTSPEVKSWVGVFRKQIHSNTEVASKRFRESGFDCFTPEGGLFVFPNIGVDDIEFKEKCLRETGVQVIEGVEFGPMGKNHIRINCGTSQERLMEAIERIISIL